MNKCFGHIAALMMSAAVFFTSCGGDGHEVIPREDLAKIYAEMLMTDQWILNTPNVRIIADTSLVYEPILGKYGYDKEDYCKSVGYYMNDPERFSKILRTTVEILDADIKRLEMRKVELERLEKLKLDVEKYLVDNRWHELYPLPVLTDKIKTADSLAFKIDTTWTYRMTHVEREDTVYEGPSLVFPPIDTLAMKTDTLVTTETLIEDGSK